MMELGLQKITLDVKGKKKQYLISTAHDENKASWYVFPTITHFAFK